MSPHVMRVAAAAAVVLSSVAGCKHKEQPIAPVANETTKGAAPAAADNAPPAKAAPAGPSVVTSSYELRAQPVGTYKAGELGTFDVTIASKGDWHVNQDFPTEVTIEHADGLKVPKSKLTKSDAAEFGMKKARFEVPFTPEQAGRHQVDADVSFAVCSAETCMPQQKKLALNLPVE